MKITKLKIKNFRCFEEFEINFNEKCTVLIGNNGSGKTAILDALAIAAGSWFINLGSGDIKARSISKNEIRRLRFVKEGLPSLEMQTPVDITATGEINGSQYLWKRELKTPTSRTTYGDAKEIRDLATEMQNQVQDGVNVDLPLIAYYGTGRLWNQKRDNNLRKESLGSRLQAYIDALEPASNQKLFEAWMAWREKSYLQVIARDVQSNLNRDQTIIAPHLMGVKKAVQYCIPECTDFFYDINNEELRLKIENEGLISFDFLSDGYRNFIGMVADIAWRAVQLNPHLGIQAPRQTKGLVLIDEIDLHLHPAWQRNILGKLLEFFEEIQFIVTTHSPQVISSAKQEWMRIVIPDEKSAYLTECVEGRDSNSILKDIMGVSIRPQWMLNDLDQLLTLIEEKNYTDATQKLEELRLKLGNNDQMLMNLEWELHDLEVHDETNN